MLMVKTVVGPSQIHGLGLFATEDIPKGSLIWRHHPYTVQVFTIPEYLKICYSLSFPALSDFVDYSYVRGQKIYYINDNTRFINHSEGPNIGFVDDFHEVALKPIKTGEEICENYLVSYDLNDFFRVNSLANAKNTRQLLAGLEEALLIEKPLYWEDITRTVCSE